MPYKSLSDLPAAVRKRSKKDQRQWMAVFDDVFRKTGNETDAFKAAYAAIKMAAAELNATPIMCFGSAFPDWEAAGKYQVQVMRTGLWKDHPSYGDILIKPGDLADAVRNFRNSSRKPFLDYNHAITNSDVPGEQEAIGWMTDMWIEDLNGNRLEPAEADKSSEKVLILKATYEVNAEANAQIKDKKYALYSPTWYTTMQNEETGEMQGLTVIGGAATNIPFFNGMEGFVAVPANEAEARAMSVMLPKASLCVAPPPDKKAGDAVAELEGMGYKVDSFEYGEYRITATQEGDKVGSISALEDAGFAVRSFYQGWQEYEAAKAAAADVETAKKIKRIAKGEQKGEETAVAEALAKAAQLKVAEEAQKAWDQKTREVEMKFEVTMA